MTRVERNLQTCEWLRLSGGQRFRWSPQSRYRLSSGIAESEAQREESLRGAVCENPRCVIVYFNQIGREPMGAINVVDQVRELIMRDCLLVMFENIPSRLATKDADVVRGMKGQRTEQKNE